MPRICPHCRHVRKENETVPDWQCPACERAYIKAVDGPQDNGYRRPAPTAIRPGRNESSSGKWLAILAFVCAAIWFGRPMLSNAGSPPSIAGSTAQPEVVLYATVWCGYCKAARSFFAANDIRYTELDIEKSSAAQAGHRRLGGNGVPLILVGDTLIHGFDEDMLRRTLKPWLKDS